LKVLCIIPARAGSKGVPRKNLAIIKGETLTARAARCASDAKVFDRIIISTDSEMIASEAIKGGAEAPFLRPPQLASDGAAIIDTVKYICIKLLKTGYTADYIALLEPTSPMRTPEIVRQTVKGVLRAKADSGQTLSLVPDNYRPMKQMALSSDGITSDVMEMGPSIYRRQDLPNTYVRNGMIYIMSRHCVMKLSKIIGPQNIGFPIKGPVINIDWPEDLVAARDIIERGLDIPIILSSPFLPRNNP
jgi:CMP-N,N'-diacetyllegionaminic acid synthase